MTPPIDTRDRTHSREEPPPRPNELAACLWVVAVLLATFQLAWWLFAGMYGP